MAVATSSSQQPNKTTVSMGPCSSSQAALVDRIHSIWATAAAWADRPKATTIWEEDSRQLRRNSNHNLQMAGITSSTSEAEEHRTRVHSISATRMLRNSSNSSQQRPSSKTRAHHSTCSESVSVELPSCSSSVKIENYNNPQSIRSSRGSKVSQYEYDCNHYYRSNPIIVR